MRIIPFIQKGEITHLQDELTLPAKFEGVQIICGTVRVIIADARGGFTSRVLIKVLDEAISIENREGDGIEIDKDRKGTRIFTLSKRGVVV